MRRVLEKKKEYVGRLLSRLADKKARWKMPEERGRSQREEDLEDHLDQLTDEISELTTSLLAAEEERMKAGVALDGLTSRKDVASELVCHQHFTSFLLTVTLLSPPFVIITTASISAT